MCWGGGEGDECEEDQNSSISRKETPQKLTQLSSRSHPRHLVGKRTAQKDITSLHVSEMFKLLGAFTPEMPITLSFLDSVLHEIQNKETREREREREREKKKYTFGHFLSN